MLHLSILNTFFMTFDVTVVLNLLYFYTWRLTLLRHFCNSLYCTFTVFQYGCLKKKKDSLCLYWYIYTFLWLRSVWKHMPYDPATGMWDFCSSSRDQCKILTARDTFLKLQRSSTATDLAILTSLWLPVNLALQECLYMTSSTAPHLQCTSSCHVGFQHSSCIYVWMYVLECRNLCIYGVKESIIWHRSLFMDNRWYINIHNNVWSRIHASCRTL